MQPPAKNSLIQPDREFWLQARENQYYQIIRQTLSEHFIPKSAWTFERNGGKLIDEYILNNEEYVGVGSGVFSYLNGMLYTSTFSLREYQKAISSGKMGLMAAHKYLKYSRMRYQLMMDLFASVLNKETFRRRFNTPLEWGLWLELLFLRLSGAFRNFGSYELTPFGRYLSLVIMREFFAGVNYLRTAARAAVDLEEKEK
jgi:coproporphyrinogen III oxidase-like Fe-S oxidoreductase